MISLITTCKFFIKEPKNKWGGICGYCEKCQYMDNPDVVCSLKTIIREYEERKGQKNLPSPSELKNKSR